MPSTITMILFCCRHNVSPSTAPSLCRGFEPRLSRSRVRHSTAEPRRLHKSYMYGKYNVSVPKTLKAGDFLSFYRRWRAWWHVWTGYGSRAADEDETPEGNPGNSNGDAVDVVPPVGMAEPGPRGPVVPCELRSAILQHGPCRLKGPLAISSSRKNTTFTLVKAVGCSAAIGNAKRVGHRCVGQPEELRSDDHITWESPSAPWCEHRFRAMEGGATHWSRPRTGNRYRGDLLSEWFPADHKHC